jgi:hypothetical protein
MVAWMGGPGHLLLTMYSVHEQVTANWCEMGEKGWVRGRGSCSPGFEVLYTIDIKVEYIQI